MTAFDHYSHQRPRACSENMLTCTYTCLIIGSPEGERATIAILRLRRAFVSKTEPVKTPKRAPSLPRYLVVYVLS